jgi:membrane-associated phospholipid phosphatase
MSVNMITATTPRWLGFVVGRFGRIDHSALHGATRARRRWLTTVLVPYTIAGTVGLPWIIAGAAVDQLRPVAVVVIAAGVIAETIKRHARRPRPDVVPLLVRRQSTASFPSGHAATSGAAACALIVAAPMLAPLWIGMAAVMAASRVYVGVHWPSDVVAGAGLGVLVAVAPLVAIAIT